MSGASIQSKHDLVQYQKTLDCVHCGLCLPACPTYELLGREGTGPRGRIYLLRGLAEGAIEPTENVQRDLDLCLVCRACEPVCPSGVRFGEMMEFGRSRLLEPHRAPTWANRLRRIAVRHLLPFPRRLRAVAWMLAAYEALGVRGLLRRYGTLKYLAPDLDLRDRLLPDMPTAERRRPLEGYHSSIGERRGRVALLEGCVQPLLLGDTNRATVRVLTEQGYDVMIPSRRTCCGALSAHFSAADVAESAAVRTIRSFKELGPVDAVLVNSAGCGAMMKEYGRLLREAPHAAADDRRAAEGFSSRVMDVTEFLMREGLRPIRGTFETTVAYADACHLAHAQGVRAAPRDLLRAVPGVTLVELDDSDRCCGAAGLFNALHPNESMALLRARLAALAKSGAKVLATANPGCILQWRAGIRIAGLDVEVIHPIEAVARAR